MFDYTLLHKNIQNWYREYGRITLPWRNTNIAYEIYLSEIMLQQTQVKTVLERFYFPFLKKFPTLKDVAQAPLDDILKAWEGLGYYTRARNLHKTAQITQGKLPTSAKALVELPGIGPSTANAVACFAFKEAVPILDANVKRILHRFFAIKKSNDKLLWKKAYELLDSKNAYIYNQALMDIGSLICKHKTPHCIDCPLEIMCQGKKSPLLYPEKKVTKSKPIKKRTVVIYSYGDQYALTQNQTNLLKGLWAFPQYQEFEYSKKVTQIGSFKHHYSHFTLEATLLVVHSSMKKELSYYSIEEIHNLALSSADKKALSLLELYLK